MSFVKSVNGIADEIENHVDYVKDDAKKAASGARSSVMDLGVQIFKFANKMMALEAQGVETVLSRVGLQRKESFLRPIGYVAVGALAGGAAVMFLAPLTGKQLRKKLASFLDSEVSELKRGAAEAQETAQKAAEKAPSAVKAEVNRIERNVPHS